MSIKSIAYPGPAAKSAGSAPTIWLWLTAPLVALTTIAAIVGLTVRDFYGDAPAWAIQAVAQDFINLFVVVPLLAVSAALAARGDQRALLVWLAGVSYLVYAFVIYAFAVRQNPLFLAYVAALSCALWAFIGGMATSDWGAIRARFSDHAPIRVVSVVLLVIAALFALLWLSEEVTAVRSGSAPASLAGTGLLTNPVHVLDLSILLPAMALAALKLWRRKPFGYGLAAIMLGHGMLQCLGIAGVMLFSLRAGLPANIALIGVFCAAAAAYLGLLAWFMRGWRGVKIED
jgi:hypothetical protein